MKLGRSPVVTEGVTAAAGVNGFATFFIWMDSMAINVARDSQKSMESADSLNCPKRWIVNLASLSTAES